MNDKHFYILAAVTLVCFCVLLRQKEGLLFSGRHCSGGLMNCAKSDPNSDITCAECLYPGMMVPAKTNQYRGCIINTSYDVNAQAQLLSARNANGTFSSQGCDWTQGPCWYGDSPWKDISGDAFIMEWGQQNQCKNGFKPVFASNTVREPRTWAWEKNKDWYSNMGYCAMSGTEFNQLISSGKGPQNDSSFTFDYSRLDPIPQSMNPAGITLAGRVGKTVGYREV